WSCRSCAPTAATRPPGRRPTPRDDPPRRDVASRLLLRAGSGPRMPTRDGTRAPGPGRRHVDALAIGDDRDGAAAIRPEHPHALRTVALLHLWRREMIAVVGADRDDGHARPDGAHEVGRARRPAAMVRDLEHHRGEAPGIVEHARLGPRLDVSCEEHADAPV